MHKTPQENFRHGILLFNRAEFFLAHEALEDAWRETHGERRRFLQGLVQVAVALYHYRGGNLVGARGVLARALRNLKDYPAQYGGIALGRLREELAPILEGAENGEALPSKIPKIILQIKRRR